MLLDGRQQLLYSYSYTLTLSRTFLFTSSLMQNCLHMKLVQFPQTLYTFTVCFFFMYLCLCSHTQPDLPLSKQYSQGSQDNKTSQTMTDLGKAKGTIKRFGPSLQRGTGNIITVSLQFEWVCARELNLAVHQDGYFMPNYCTYLQSRIHPKALTEFS